MKTIRNITILLILLGATYFALAKFTNFLPDGFNFFKSETIMKETPVLIEQIKEIDQLIGAEFYGEVYADLFTSYNDLIDEYGKNIHQITHKYIFLQEYSKIKFQIKELDTSIKKHSTQLYLLDSLTTYSDSTRKIYRIYLDSLKTTIKDIPKGRRETEKRERYEYVDKEINTMKNKLEQATDNYLKFSKKHKKTLKTKNSIQKKRVAAQKKITAFMNKRNLVYIGRGHTSAGFDMKKLNISNLDTTTSNKSINLQLPLIQLIDTVINPWYYKNSKDSLMGYEIYINKKDRLYTNDDVMLVKQKCRKNLASSALNKGIINLATKNGTKAIESFFFLLGFEEVTIINEQLTIEN